MGGAITALIAQSSGLAQCAHKHGLCSQRWRETSAEKRDKARLNTDLVNEVRRAAEVHRQVSSD